MKKPDQTADRLEVVRLGKDDWRVSDQNGDLLGYIERQHADRYEIVWMSDPLRWGYIETFDGAVEAFGASVRFAGEESPQRIKDLNPSRASAGRSPRRGTWVKSKGRPNVA